MSGTFNGRTAVESASDAENALRAIVHLCEADKSPLGIEDVYRTMSGLARLLEPLSEAVTRLRAVAQQHADAGQVQVAVGRWRGDADGAVQAMSDAVADFLTHLGPTLTDLQRAQGALSEVEPRAT